MSSTGSAPEMDILRQGFQASFGGIFSLLPLVFTYVRTLPPNKALYYTSLLMCAFGVSSMALKQVSHFKRTYDQQVIITADAILRDNACADIAEVLRYDPSVGETCNEARRIVRTWPSERALALTIESWPTPWDVGSSLLTSFENKITTIGIVAYLGATVLPFLVGPPVQMLRGHYIDNQIKTLHKMHGE